MLWLGIINVIYKGDYRKNDKLWQFISSCYKCTRIKNTDSHPLDISTSIVTLTYKDSDNANNISHIDIECDNFNLGAFAATNFIEQTDLYAISPKLQELLGDFIKTTLLNELFVHVLLACFDYSDVKEFESLRFSKNSAAKQTFKALCDKIISLIEPDSPQYYLVLQKNYDIECKFVRVQAQLFNFLSLIHI